MPIITASSIQWAKKKKKKEKKRWKKLTESWGETDKSSTIVGKFIIAQKWKYQTENRKDIKNFCISNNSSLKRDKLFFINLFLIEG